ncbi:MAG: TIGR04076 family protein [Desulfobacterales bacterium]|nr:MAG: TIGR04076 family protein [Desulfobacterales bacterium]
MHRLKITVEKIEGYCNLPMLVGDSFTIEDRGQIVIPPGKFACLWALQSMMPIFPLLQRTETQKGDWSRQSRQVFVCPDPKGRVHYRIERITAE